MIRSLFILCLLILLVSCEEDVQLFTSGDPVPVVYCILDPELPVQTLRLSRSYQAEGSTSSAAQPDSLVIEGGLEVLIEEIGENGVTKQAIFEPVKVFRDSGSMSSTELWIYQADLQIHTAAKYQIVIHLDNYEKLLYSSCLTVAPFELLNPSYPEVREIHMQPGYNPRYFWTQSQNAGVYQLGFIFYYEEYLNGQVDEKSLDVQFNTTVLTQTGDQVYSRTINSSKLYMHLEETLTIDSSIIRKSLGVEPYIICGGSELADLLRIQDGGYRFNIMEYSNIGNGIGVFSSRLTRKAGMFKLTDQTIDSIAYGSRTIGLNFLDRNGQRKSGRTKL